MRARHIAARDEDPGFRAAPGDQVIAVVERNRTRNAGRLHDQVQADKRRPLRRRARDGPGSGHASRCTHMTHMSFPELDTEELASRDTFIRG
jgi:hypothetical protein